MFEFDYECTTFFSYTKIMAKKHVFFLIENKTSLQLIPLYNQIGVFIVWLSLANREDWLNSFLFVSNVMRENVCKKCRESPNLHLRSYEIVV